MPLVTARRVAAPRAFFAFILRNDEAYCQGRMNDILRGSLRRESCAAWRFLEQ
ncbi:hypothetical protein [Nitrosomonas sp.]|uniref:hypothetical protein n=1 Tax=Nitrosomonas sp. TaxID=42353 RepID=UPI001E05925E|nr:hypothetical protein [Nitrosomonas sp.]MCB1947534.1 hypothetical protein [Nitrosomonas sp.]